MYCGICVEVCPFDALFWSPEFEYAEYDIDELIHEKERLEEWTYTVLPPPALEEGAEAPGGGEPRDRARSTPSLVLAVVGSLAAIAVVTARNVVHAALYLVVTLSCVGGTSTCCWGRSSSGWVQILIYVGAIVILFLFGLMLTKAPIGRDTLDNQQRWLGDRRGGRRVRGARVPDPGRVPRQDAVAPRASRPRPA